MNSGIYEDHQDWMFRVFQFNGPYPGDVQVMVMSTGSRFNWPWKVKCRMWSSSGTVSTIHPWPRLVATRCFTFFHIVWYESMWGAKIPPLFQWLHVFCAQWAWIGRWKSAITATTAMTAASLCWPPSNPLISRTSKRTKRRCTQRQAMPSYAAIPSRRQVVQLNGFKGTHLRIAAEFEALSNPERWRWFRMLKYARIRRQKNVDFLRCHWMWSDSVLVYECLSSTEEEQNNSTLGLALSDKHTVMARLCLFQFNCNLRCCCSSPRDCPWLLPKPSKGLCLPAFLLSTWLISCPSFEFNMEEPYGILLFVSDLGWAVALRDPSIWEGS